MPTTVTVDNCELEPIHIPGAIQPHGALIALNGQTLEVQQVSDNLEQMIGIAPAKAFGLPLEKLVDAPTAALIRNNAQTRSWKRFNPMPVEVNGKRFDGIVHRFDERLIVELEPADKIAQGTYRDYGADTHQAMVRLQGAESISELLQSAAETVRWVTGYDRVMVYRFDHDLHGEVVAEDRQQSLEPFLGLHYPASDIPAQARRLYLLNWLRVIVDIGYKPAALLAAPNGKTAPKPLDLTHATLRSVSPIHVEYLQNMGVGASMSVSLVLDGKLWGLIACHHYAPKLLPYTVRMTCELLGQMLSTLIGSWTKRDEADELEQIGQRRVRLTEKLSAADYVAKAFLEGQGDFLGMVGASGGAVLEDGRCTLIGATPTEEQVRAFAAWMMSRHETVTTSQLNTDYPTAPSLGPDVAGVLALGMPQTENNAVMWFRPVVERTVSWAGNPEKKYLEGPNGPRLSPRGSFTLWKETVKNKSERWSKAEVDAAIALRASLSDLLIRKGHENERSREMLLGMVSHDLRNPLGAITLAAATLGRGGGNEEKVTRASARIAASSDRMKRMIEQLLDFNRARSSTFHLNTTDFDLVTLCKQLVEETEVAHPAAKIQLQLPEKCPWHGDPDRIAQVISNLLGNSRHHGDPSKPVTLSLRCHDAGVELEVKNEGAPIPAEKLATLFEPFKKADPAVTRSAQRHQGLGLGLFIVKSLVDVHGGTVTVKSTPEGVTTATVSLPRK